MNLAVTTWPSLNADHPGRRHHVSWTALARWLALDWPKFGGTWNHRGWSPALFAANHRDLASVEQAFALGLDIDHEPTIEAGLAPWRGFQAVWHTTRNHGHVSKKNPTGGPRVRIVLALSRPVSADEYAKLWRWASERSGGAPDEGAADASRFWFCPGPVNGTPAEAGAIEGEPLDVDAILDGIAEREAIAAANELPPAPKARANVDNGAGKPGEDFARRTSWAAILEPHGWTRRYQKGENTYWRRPDHPDKRAVSASSNEAYLVVWSSNAPPLQVTRKGSGLPCYDKLGAFAALEHGGDLRAAVKALAAHGFGEQRPRPAGAPPVEATWTGVAGDCDPGDLPPDPEAEPAAQTGEATALDWPTLAETAERIASTPIVRIATGLPTLDALTRGGFPLGRRFALLGCPGASKTTLMCDWAERWARQGIHVAFVAADEEPEGLLIRVGQLLGLDRGQLEAHAPATWAELAARLRTELPRLNIFDGGDDGQTVDEVSLWLEREAHGEPAVLLTDSVQMAKAHGSVEADGPRARVDAVLAAQKRASRRGQLVGFTSEVSRGVYASPVKANRTNLLAGGKESSGIEYGVAVQIVLLPVEGTDDLVDVALPKNRLGRKGTFRLRQCFTRASLVEVAVAPVDEDEDEEEQARRAMDRILAVLAKRSDLRTREELRRRSKLNQNAFSPALAQLKELGAVIKLGGCFRAVPEADREAQP